MVFEVDPVDEFHRQVVEVDVGIVAAFEERDDVGMIEHGGVTGLAPKTIEGAAVFRQRGGQDFQGDGSAQDDVDGPIHGPHAAGRNVGRDFIFADAKAWVENVVRHIDPSFTPRTRLHNAPRGHGLSRTRGDKQRTLHLST